MATVEVTSENFEKLVQDNAIVVLDFWASWCQPCLRFGPIFEEASETHPNIVFGKINTEKQQQLAGQFGIRSIPTIVIYRDEIPIYSQPGAFPAPAFADLLAKVQEVDMDEIRQKLADAKAAGEV